MTEPTDFKAYKLRKRVAENPYLQRHLARGTITQAQAEACQSDLDELREAGLLPLTPENTERCEPIDDDASGAAE